MNMRNNNGGLELEWLGDGQFGLKRKRDLITASEDANHEHENNVVEAEEKIGMISGGQVEFKQHFYYIARSRRMKVEIFSFLEGCRTVASKIYHGSIFLLILVSLALSITLTIDEFKSHKSLSVALLVLEFILLIVFVTEYILRIWSCGVHGHYYGNILGKLRYAVTPHMVIDLLIILSSIALVVAAQLHLDPQTERSLHLLQLMRVLRIDRQRGAFRMFHRVILKHRKELLTCWYMSFIMVMFVSFLVYCVERRPGDVTLDNLFNGFYWGVISLTSIGYGDISPNTAVGKMLICFFALVGTAFFAMPAGIIGSGFALQVAEQAKEKHINRKRRPAAVLIQSVWRRYAGDRDFPGTWIRHVKNRAHNEARRLSRIAVGRISRVDFSLGNENDRESRNISHNKSDAKGLMKALTKAEKDALRFTRRLKIIAAVKNFRQARRPYDERDILDQFAAGQIEMFVKLKQLQLRVDKVSTNIERQNAYTAFSDRIMGMEEEVEALREQVNENSMMLKEILRRVSPADTK